MNERLELLGVGDVVTAERNLGSIPSLTFLEVKRVLRAPRWNLLTLSDGTKAVQWLHDGSLRRPCPNRFEELRPHDSEDDDMLARTEAARRVLRALRVGGERTLLKIPSRDLEKFCDLLEKI